jgi:hypothetical protein
LIILRFKKHENLLKPWRFFFYFSLKYMGEMVGAGAEIFVKLEPEPHKNGPAPQHWCAEHHSTVYTGSMWNRDITVRSSRQEHKLKGIVAEPERRRIILVATEPLLNAAPTPKLMLNMSWWFKF